MYIVTAAKEREERLRANVHATYDSAQYSPLFLCPHRRVTGIKQNALLKMQSHSHFFCPHANRIECKNCSEECVGNCNNTQKHTTHSKELPVVFDIKPPIQRHGSITNRIFNKMNYGVQSFRSGVAMPGNSSTMCSRALCIHVFAMCTFASCIHIVVIQLAFMQALL